jgi:hypothetical protein
LESYVVRIHHCEKNKPEFGAACRVANMGNASHVQCEPDTAHNFTSRKFM